MCRLTKKHTTILKKGPLVKGENRRFIMAKSKKIATVVAAFAAAFVVLSAAEVKAVPVESGDIRYEVSVENGTATVEKALGTERDVIVKKAVKLGSNSYPVVAIADEAFATLTTTSVKLPETIESIGNRAFYRCVFLRDINIPEGLLKVGENAFGGCEITPVFPEGCEVPENVFTLKESETENGNETITDGTENGEEAKSEDEKSDDKVADPGNGGAENGGETPAEQPATNEQSNNAQNQVQVNAEDPLLIKKKDDQASPASASTSEATTQTTAQTTTETAKASVVDTFSLNGSTYELLTDGTAVLKKVSLKKKTLRVPNSVSYQGRKYKVVAIRKNAAKGCDKLVKVTLKGNLKEIGTKAFYGCKKLKKVNVKNVTKIGDKAFYGCKRLKSVSSNGQVTVVGKKAFGKTSKKLDVTGLLR
jgi:hypothetical protein